MIGCADPASLPARIDIYPAVDSVSASLGHRPSPIRPRVRWPPSIAGFCPRAPARLRPSGAAAGCARPGRQRGPAGSGQPWRGLRLLLSITAADRALDPFGESTQPAPPARPPQGKPCMAARAAPSVSGASTPPGTRAAIPTNPRRLRPPASQPRPAERCLGHCHGWRKQASARNSACAVRGE